MASDSRDGTLEATTIGDIRDLLKPTGDTSLTPNTTKPTRLKLDGGKGQPIPTADDQLSARIPSARPEKRKSAAQHRLYNAPGDGEWDGERHLLRQKDGGNHLEYGDDQHLIARRLQAAEHSDERVPGAHQRLRHRPLRCHIDCSPAAVDWKR